MAHNIVPDLEPLARPIKELKPAQHNPRQGDVGAIKKSYERFGQRKPIVANRKTKEVIAGNHQLMAAQELGWDKIAVVWVDDDEATAVAYGVADNRIGQLGEWNVEELVSALGAIAPLDLEAVGFSESEYEDYVALLDEQVGAVAAVGPMDGGQDRAGVDTDTKVKKDSSYEDFLERYANRAVRAIILYYPNEEYGKMVEDLKTLSKRYDAEDNAETVAALVREKLNG